MLATVLRHRWKQLVRGASVAGGCLQAVVVLVMGGYLVIAAVVLGAVFPAIAERAAPQTSPAALLNGSMLAGLLALVGARFFLQPSTQTDLRPYLSLPISRRRLAYTVQGVAAPDPFAGLTLCFLVPVWVSTIRPAGGGLAWLGGALLLVIATRYLVLPLRVAAGWYGQRFWMTTATVVALLAVDHAAAASLTRRPGLVRGASSALFGGLAAEAAPPRLGALLAAGLALGGSYAASVHFLLHGLRTADTASRASRSFGRVGRWLAHLQSAGLAGSLAVLEARLIARNARVRTQAILAPLFGIGYGVVTARGGDLYGSAFLLGFVGVFSSGAFALFYGQYLFSWESDHLEGLLTRTSSARTLLRAKLHFLQGSCFALWAAGLPLFAWLAPGALGMHAAFLLFNAGVVCPLMVTLGLFATKPIDLSKSSFFNYEGASWVQFAQLVLVVLPAVLLMLAPAPWRLWSAAGVGLAGLLGAPLWTRLLARLFTARRHRMLAGFRAS